MTYGGSVPFDPLGRRMRYQQHQQQRPTSSLSMLLSLLSSSRRAAVRSAFANKLREWMALSVRRLLKWSTTRFFAKMLCRVVIFLAIAQVVVSQDAESFSCVGRPQGYYADVSSGCQLYHMCDGVGRQFSYSCPSDTLFQQRMMICDHWYMVNCSKSEPDYEANLLIGQRDKPFVDDSVEHPYYRTPRPNLSLNSLGEASTSYRRMRSRKFSNFDNVVGLEADKSDPKKPTYTPPGRWYTGSLIDKNANSNLKKRKIPVKIKPGKQPLKNTKFQQKNQNKGASESSTVSNILKELSGHTLTDRIVEIATTKRTTGVTGIDAKFQELRKLFLIPDFQFPLESEGRPNYDDKRPTSFDVKAIPNKR